jgi:hypothetical protein
MTALVHIRGWVDAANDAQELASGLKPLVGHFLELHPVI